MSVAVAVAAAAAAFCHVEIQTLRHSRHFGD